MSAARAYFCPMHADIRSVDGGICPICHMSLVPAGARWPMLHHVFSRRHVIVMLLAMAAVMAAAMMMR